ncbi:ceramidase [Amylostereum chailletii]|nr:ceramidase [Amylostereum chailletii]
MTSIQRSGIWGPVTATLDWCEANYQFSHYIAESANAWSNAATLAFAAYGVKFVFTESLPARYFGSFAGLALVALGSFAFHATLLYEAQMADELPMIYTTSWSNYLLLDTRPGFASTAYSKYLMAATLVFNILFTWSYSLYRNPVYHQVVFGLLLVTSTTRTLYLTQWSATSLTLPDKKKQETMSLMRIGALLFVIGFAIWNVDNVFCGTITGWKHAVGWPVAFLLEGHSWWHAFTGAGSYFMLQGTIYLSLCLKGDHHHYALHYTYGLPAIRRVTKSKAN